MQWYQGHTTRKQLSWVWIISPTSRSTQWQSPPMAWWLPCSSNITLSLLQISLTEGALKAQRTHKDIGRTLPSTNTKREETLEWESCFNATQDSPGILLLWVIPHAEVGSLWCASWVLYAPVNYCRNSTVYLAGAEWNFHCLFVCCYPRISGD